MLLSSDALLSCRDRVWLPWPRSTVSSSRQLAREAGGFGLLFMGEEGGREEFCCSEGVVES